MHRDQRLAARELSAAGNCDKAERIDAENQEFPMISSGRMDNPNASGAVSSPVVPRGPGQA
jgi:hypothetical protein